jgi:hypothetical protein
MLVGSFKKIAITASKIKSWMIFSNEALIIIKKLNYKKSFILDNNSSPLLMVKVSYYKPVFTA